MLDLPKTFDSVDQNMARQILLSRGVPPKLVALIKDLRTGHSAIITELSWTQLLSQQMRASNKAVSSHLICSHSPWTLLHANFFHNFRSLPQPNPYGEDLMWILLYAVDICDDIDNLRKAVAVMDTTFLQWGLISLKKTKVLVVSRNAEVQKLNATITIRGDTLEVVSEVKYLGSIFTSDSTLDAETPWPSGCLTDELF
ncbi:hypothetical protein ABBQ38_014582 [Trebouxia sp. C0009 RCD-2024]